MMRLIALSKDASSSTNAIIKSESITCKIINDFNLKVC